MTTGTKPEPQSTIRNKIRTDTNIRPSRDNSNGIKPPSPETEKLQDSDHTEDDFLSDLDRATRRKAPPS